MQQKYHILENVPVPPCYQIAPSYRKLCSYPHVIKLLYYIENCARTPMFYTANVNKFAILSQTVLKLGIKNLGSYMRLSFEYQHDILSNTKVSLAKIHGVNYMNFRLLMVSHLLCNHLLLFLRTLK